MVPPHRPAQVLLDSGLAETETGIRVDYDTLKTKWDNVYAIGDCADMPASKAGGVAHQEADFVAHNLAVEITGKGSPSISGCTLYDCWRSARDAPPQIAQFIPLAGRHSASLNRAPGGRHGLSTGQRLVSRSGGYGVIFDLPIVSMTL